MLDLLGCALGDYLTAVLARAGAKIDYPVSAADGFVIMLYHQDGIAQVAQALQRVEQAARIARVQPDGRFIQHVEHAHQARADLRG